MPEFSGFFDGLCEPCNPGGVATWGYVLQHGSNAISADSGVASEPFTEEATNNTGEYMALIRLLERCVALGLSGVRVYGDSQLVVKQVNGIYAVRSERILPLHARASTLMALVPAVVVQWVPREENRAADQKSREAYEKFVAENDCSALMLPFGKHAGLDLATVAAKDPGYLRWLASQNNMREGFKRIIDGVLGRREREAA